MPGNQRSGVFLSYSWADGEPFAASLREKLREKTPDIPVKQDRVVLEGGIGWWKQLTEAIDSVEFLVLIMTPSAMQSETVRKEWQYARQQGVCVYPVKGAPDSALQFSNLPLWMAKAHFFDLEKEWESFIAHLRKGCDTPRVPFMAPDLPDNFVKRQDEFGRLKSLLLNPHREGAVAITTALSGAGGFGKTTLAAALCHDEEIIQNFDDGILWVTLGQNPSVMGSLITAYAALTGERPGFASEEDAAFQLAQKLEHRTCLLVIDDVWDESHVRPFLRGGKGCARLFTTRIAEIASNALPVNVDEMSEAESLALLSNGIPGLTASRARELSQRMGEWPFALELARAMMRQRIAQGASAEHAAQRLLQILDKRGPAGLERSTGDPRHRTIDSVLESTLELLNGEDRRRLTELSIFPEDVAIPLSVVAVLWGLDEFESEETAQRFARLYLLKLDLSRGSLRLHDMMRNWLGASTTNAVELHSRLVDGWPDWTRFSDGYAWRWLTWHLAKANRTADIERVLWDPAWLRAKLDATDVHALITDFEYLRPAREAILIQEALRLSSHVLAKERSQLASQMIGRLLPHSEQANIQRFMGSLRGAASRPWLRPLKPALDSPGTGLLRTLAGHARPVQAVALDPRGQRAVSGSDDRTLKVWDLLTGFEIRTLAGHSEAVRGVAMSPDGRCAVSASEDHTLKLWDLETGLELRTLAGHSDFVTGVAMSADGRVAVSASDDHTLKIWELGTGTELHTLAGHSESVNGVAISPDGLRAVSASDDKTVKMWDLETGRELSTLAGHSEPVNCVAISPYGSLAVSASDDKTLKVWDLETGGELRSLTGHTSWVTGVAVSPDGRRVVSASQDNTVKVWDIESGRELRTLTGHASWVISVALSSDGRRIVSASWDQTLKVWDIEAAVELRTGTGHSRTVTSVAVTPDGKRGVSASEDKSLRMWDLKTCSELRTIGSHAGRVNSVAVSSTGRQAVSASYDRTLKSWDLETGNELRTLVGHSSWVTGVALTPDRRLVVSASYDHTLKIWDFETGTELHTLVGHSSGVNGVAVSSDGHRAVSASRDHTLKIWDLETGTGLRTLVGHAESVYGVAITPNASLAVSASRDNTLKVWDLETGQELRTLGGHSAGVSCVAVSPDGLRAVSASRDSTLKAWDLKTGAVIATFTCDSSAECCVFVNDFTIFAGDHAGRVHVLALEATNDLGLADPL